MRAVLFTILFFSILACSSSRQLVNTFNNSPFQVESNKYAINLYYDSPQSHNSKLVLEGIDNDLNSLCFQMSIFNKENNPIQSKDYKSYLTFFTFGFGDYIKLIAGNDTLNCDSYYGERSYQLSPISHAFLSFKPQSNSLEKVANIQILIKKNDYFNDKDMVVQLSK